MVTTAEVPVAQPRHAQAVLEGKLTATMSPDRELLGAVLAYQHDPLLDRLQKKLCVSEDRARQIFEDTKRFLFICGTCHGKWSPTRDIDEGWHNFILFTKDYMEFCERFFGRFIHHVPNLPGQKPDGDRSRRTLIAAMQLFGKENLSGCWVYCDVNGKLVLGPSLDMAEVAGAMDPCDSCGCNAACNDD